MSRYINFYTIEGDYALLLYYAGEAGLAAVPRIIKTEDYNLKKIDTAEPMEFSCSDMEQVFYFTHRDIPVSEILYSPIRMDPENSFLMAHLSPVIECTPSRTEEHRLCSGRLYIDAPKDSPWSKKIYDSYELISKFVKKWPKIEKQTHAGPATFRTAKEGNVKLMASGRELRIF